MGECKLSGNCCKDNMSVDYLEVTIRKMCCECGLSGNYCKEKVSG